MQKICKVDENMIYTGVSAELASDKDRVPRGWVATEPPKEFGVWQWQSTRWGKLDKYPAAQPVPEPKEKTKDEYVAELETRKEKDALIALIDERIAQAKTQEAPK